MGKIITEASAIIDARAEDIYEVISDYRVGHPAILPKPDFGELIVVKGGRGAGTEMRFTMRVLGKEYHFHQLVSEPEPGRLLVETEIERDLVTTFRFEPLENGSRTRLIIKTVSSPSKGLAGIIEKLFQPAITRKIYRKELAQIAEYVGKKYPKAVPSTN
jgi:hypothetical protein